MTLPADLVFDLDGTISNPLVGISRSIDYALEAHGLPPVPARKAALLIGPPLDEVFRALIPAGREAEIGSLVTKYRDRYSRAGYLENVLYDGMPDVLAGLVDAGLALGVCTSKRRDIAVKVLEHFDLSTHFRFVDGGDVSVTKEQQLSRLLDSGAIGKRSRMIGDRAVDIRAARANGLTGIGVLWGYGTHLELRDAGADRILERVQDLTALTASD